MDTTNKSSHDNPKISSCHLRHLPVAWKWTTSLFVLLLAVGQGFTLWHHRLSREHLDGRAGLSLEDVKIALRGTAPPPPEPQRTVEDSPMWLQVHGLMKSYFRDGRDLAIVEAWLRAGATEATFDWPWTFDGDTPLPVPAPQVVTDASRRTPGISLRSPRRIFRESCVSCHGPGGLRAQSPLTTHAHVARYVSPPPLPRSDTPPSLDRFVQATSARLLTMPILALALAALFYFSDWPQSPPALRAAITVLPMAALAVEVMTSWLARGSELFVYPPIAARVVFVLGTIVQMIGVLGGVWRSETVNARASE